MSNHLILDIRSIAHKQLCVPYAV